jgi:hypothetical protein
LRSLATKASFRYQQLQRHYAENPNFYVEDILSGEVHETIMQCFSSNIPKNLMQAFREIMDPTEVLSWFLLPTIKCALEEIEASFIEKQYRLPKWQRPEWLSEPIVTEWAKKIKGA